MKRFFQLTATLFCMLLAVGASGQRVVDIPVSTDPAMPTDISPIIMGDTMPNGDRVDNNTIYRLANGGIYTTTFRLVNTPDWPLHIEAVDLETTAQINKPVITRTPNAEGSYQPVMHPQGDVTLKNLWIISGETGPGEQHNWGQMRFFGEGSTVIVEDCVIEKDRGGFLQFRADGVKCYVNNCVFRNGGNRFILEGNGRGIDSRQFAMDTLVVTNSVIHNIVDRVFRSLGNVSPHNYIEFSNNTIFNQFGRHGGIVLEQANNFVFTNNLWINPNMMGASPRYADEQNNPDNEVNKLFTLDTLVTPTNVTISNNNLFWTDDVRAIWAKHDTVTQPPVFSTLIQQAMGDTTGAYFSEEVTLRGVPVRITEYLDDLLANPAAEDMFDVIVQDVAVTGTARDFGNLYDFLGVIDGMADFDPCYDLEGTQSATAATDGGAVGARTICGLMLTTSIYDNQVNETLALEAYPNPVQSVSTFNYELKGSGLVRLSIYDLSGRVVEEVVNAFQPTGTYNVEWSSAARMPAGTYIARLQTQEGQMAIKIMVTK